MEETCEMAIFCICRNVSGKSIADIYKRALNDPEFRQTIQSEQNWRAQNTVTPAELFNAAVQCKHPNPCNICMGNNECPEEERMMARVKQIMAKVDAELACP